MSDDLTKATVTLYLTIPLEPVAKGRPRCDCRGGTPRLRTPRRTAAWEAQAATIVRSQARSSERLTGAIQLRIDAIHPRPSRRPRGVSPERWKSGERVPKPTKPDVDNVAKAIMDALTMAGIWVDDALVFRIEVAKWYASISEKPSVQVVVIEQETP